MRNADEILPESSLENILYESHQKEKVVDVDPLIFRDVIDTALKFYISYNTFR